MSIKLVTVDNDIVELEKNKVVGKNSRFDGMDVKTNADIMKVFGIKPKVNINDYKFPDQTFGDAGERQLYLDAVKVFRGEITGARAEQIMNAVQGEFNPDIIDKIRKDALKGSPTMEKLFPTLQNMSKEEPNYGDMIPRIPEGYVEPKPKKTFDTMQPIFRPGVDPMGLPPRRMSPTNMTTGPKQLNKMLMANMMGLLK
jgi:hypothetical protein